MSADVKPFSPRKRVLACAIGFTLFAIYGSLVPLNYQFLKWGDAVAQFRQVVHRPVSTSNRLDFATNILLFIPLGFSWLGWAAIGGSRGGGPGRGPSRA